MEHNFCCRTPIDADLPMLIGVMEEIIDMMQLNTYPREIPRELQNQPRETNEFGKELGLADPQGNAFVKANPSLECWNCG